MRGVSVIDTVLSLLRCPICADALAREGGSLRCPRGHGFDLARQGYAHLGAGRRLPTGDTAEMVAARSAFLQAGHYARVRAAVAALVPADAEVIADAGAGIGYYLAGALDAAPAAAGLALDVAKPALKRAARCHPRAGAVLADVWGGLPIRDAAVDVLLDVFAPRNGPEFARILRPGGRLIVVTPLPEHLAELRARYGLLDVDPEKRERLAATLKEFAPGTAGELRWTMALRPAEVATLVGMGPNAFHAGAVDAGRQLTDVTAAVSVAVYTPR
ncbi:MAG: 23S rRNA methyltransferase [Hamadaea sp.]|nr:23S rRNA methyltransferase [Hamadaea sp.]